MGTGVQLVYVSTHFVYCLCKCSSAYREVRLCQHLDKFTVITIAILTASYLSQFLLCD